jgi:LmbE family N-acetylglucosaminyl deacetylase
LYPDVGEAWSVAKLYFGTFPKTAMFALSRMLEEQGLPSPFGRVERPEDLHMGADEADITATVDVRPWLDRKLPALRAHATQLGPESFFLNVPEHLEERVFGTEFFIRRWSTVAAPQREEDLFEGLAS